MTHVTCAQRHVRRARPAPPAARHARQDESPEGGCCHARRALRTDRKGGSLRQHRSGACEDKLGSERAQLRSRNGRTAQRQRARDKASARRASSAAGRARSKPAPAARPRARPRAAWPLPRRTEGAALRRRLNQRLHSAPCTACSAPLAARMRLGAAPPRAVAPPRRPLRRCAATRCAAAAAADARTLYPAAAARVTGTLAVGAPHVLHFEEYGNPGAQGETCAWRCFHAASADAPFTHKLQRACRRWWCTAGRARRAGRTTRASSTRSVRALRVFSSYASCRLSLSASCRARRLPHRAM